MAPRNFQEPAGTPRNPQEGGVRYLDSPSLNVALRELGFTFLALFMWLFKTPVSESPVTDALTLPFPAAAGVMRIRFTQTTPFSRQTRQIIQTDQQIVQSASH